MARIARITEIPISQINLGPIPTVPDPFAFRSNVEDLMDSLKKFGQLQPIIVYEAGGGKYEVIAGRRRVMAVVQLQALTIWAAVMDERVEVDEGNAMWLSENLVRQVSDEDVRAVIEALLKKHGTVKMLASKTGLPLEKVQHYTGHK